MYIDPPWGDIPQLVLTTIYSLLNRKDRLSAASTCWQWRTVLFQPRFFETVVFDVCREREAENAFYLESVAHYCHTITVCFNPQMLYGVQKTLEILEKIKSDNCAQRLIFRPKHSSMLMVQFKSFVQALRTFLSKRIFPLHELDLGGMESLALHANELLRAIECGQQVDTLGLATVKSQPSYYLVKPLSLSGIGGFRHLFAVSLDYDYFTDEWLQLFENLRFLRQLTVHVHGLEEDTHPGTSNAAWKSLSAKNSALRLQLVLVYAYNAVHLLHSHILNPAMPLSHLKVLFCEHLNTAAIECLSNYYAATLRSIVWADLCADPTDYFEQYEQDPLVMMAWRCKQLVELVLNGYYVDPMNIIGVARLRGPSLVRLEVSEVEWSPQLCDEISKQLERNWTPLPKTHMNSIFINDGQFNEQLQNEYVMRCVHSALKFKERI